MEYIREGSTLATPFNLVPTWKGVYTLHKHFADNWCYRMAGRKAPDKSEVKATLEKKKKNVAKVSVIYSLLLHYMNRTH